MIEDFFEHPILNSPYQYPSRHWELDETGQPTQQIAKSRRRVSFITPIPKPRQASKTAQASLILDEGKGISSQEQQYDPTGVITTSPASSASTQTGRRAWRTGASSCSATTTSTGTS
jgi:type III restriction enzyme